MFKYVFNIDKNLLLPDISKNFIFITLSWLAQFIRFSRTWLSYVTPQRPSFVIVFF